MRYVVSFAAGRPDKQFPTYAAAVAALTAEWPEAEIGHSGDLLDGGDRTLCWPNEKASINDDGLRAVATIRRV
jgi:hypothetical protein